MDEKVSDEKKMMVMTSLKHNIDELMYNSNSLDTATTYFNQYREWITETRNADDDIMEKVIAQLDILSKKFGAVGPEMEEELNDTLKWLFRKIGWKPKKNSSNVGYASYEDMLLRYRDLKKELDNMKMINKQVSVIMPRVVQEHLMMCTMNEKLDEIRFRYKLIEVAKALNARNLKEKDPLSPICFLALVLPGLIYNDNTSKEYASKLLRRCKRLLVIVEAVQYERSPTNEPIVTLSDILNHPPHSTVPSFCVPAQVAEGNGEVLAPEEKILPVARDSAHTLIASENGEVSATSEMNMPIAKDSVTMMGSKESPKPLSTTGAPVAKSDNIQSSNIQKSG